MKFLYCTEDGNLRPRGWILWSSRCELCGNKMVKIKVPMTKITPFYYTSLLITAIVLGMFLFEMDIPYESWTLIGLVAITMILAFFDYSKSYYRAKKMIEAEKAKAEKTLGSEGNSK